MIENPPVRPIIHERCEYVCIDGADAVDTGLRLAAFEVELFVVLVVLLLLPDWYVVVDSCEYPPEM
tara:strand:+ start:315 stop:512 length:198 start_codon:yes stop_codon:yes gene_type:complete